MRSRCEVQCFAVPKLLGHSVNEARLLILTFQLVFPTMAGYIGEFEEVDDHRSGKVVIQLNGRINKCGVISPRFNVQLGQIENWVQQLLPARSFGYVVLTTSSGIMDHEEARRKHVAGKILGFFY
ncbi:SSU ribosomal protein S8P [Pseudozyma hubeiensis SY62]|uniref:SSU ribosomal protein S8P n=1 Tax=Pseudozyma hubeiensis (strain SY62) TaxID=1305764 RepID=R9PC62_PSEHS|nr:SSU ribosomal protein S8P [Pseudozyma hubeiensis SY62]GAC98961.1 SSU ribosomal protein S8P [Pseudozyma hubeiensis SY62]